MGVIVKLGRMIWGGLLEEEEDGIVFWVEVVGVKE